MLVFVVYIVIGWFLVVVGKLEKVIFEVVVVRFGVMSLFFIGDCFDIDILGVNWVGMLFVFVLMGIDCVK